MNYRVKADGREIELLQTTILPPPYNHTEKMPFAIITADKPIDLVITSKEKLSDVLIRPLSVNLEYKFDEENIYIHLDKPQKFSVEINGSYKNNILIFASEKRDENINPNDKKVIYFPKGEHVADVIRIEEDDMTLYLEEGALVHGKILANNCNNLKICGFGAISSERYNRENDRIYERCVEINNCRNFVMRDVTVLDSSGWSVRIMGCDDVHIDNINIIGWRGNSDGVDVCGSRNVLVEKCFIRNWDDGFVAKAFDTGDLENVTFRDSTLWNDFARPIEVGVEIRAEYARNITFSNIDVIHSLTGYPILGIHHGDRAKLRNITFSDIRIEDAPGAQMFDIRITHSAWNRDTSMGDIDGVTIKDIYFVEDQAILPSKSRIQGYSKENSIKNVTLENICYLGKFATTVDECQVNVMDFVENVGVKYPETAEKVAAVRTAVEISDDFTLAEDGMYEGKVKISVENRDNDKAEGEVYLQVSPVNMTDIPDNSLKYSLKKGESTQKEYTLRLQPGKYVFCIQSENPTVEASWQYKEFELVLKDNIENAPEYKIVNYYGDRLDGIKLAVKDDCLIIKSDALKKNKFTVYSAMPAWDEGIKFTVEETDFGEAMAVMVGSHGLEAAPQLRCPAEITYVFKNEPKVEKIVETTVGGKDCDTVKIPFEQMGIEKNSKKFWFDIEAKLPETEKYRYKFTMFHSVWPDKIAHMFARARVE